MLTEKPDGFWDDFSMDTKVLPIPPGQAPGRIAESGRPSRSPAACESSKGATPATLALVAVTGPTADASAMAVGWATTRTATRFPPSRASSGT